MSLHEQILAEIERRTKIAEAAGSATRSEAWWETADPLGYHVEPVERSAPVMGRVVLRAGSDMGASPDESADIASHIALHDPADALRRYAAARRVLERHKAIEWYEGDTGCWYCSGETDASHRAVAWPCPDVTDLADSLGIDLVDGGEVR